MAAIIIHPVISANVKAPYYHRKSISSNFAASSYGLRTAGSFTFSYKSTNFKATSCPAVSCSIKPLAETELIKIVVEEGTIQSVPSQPGVYAVYDSSDNLQYIGLSRRVSSSIEGHAVTLPELCHSVKVAVLEASSRDALAEAWQTWMQEHIDNTGVLPAGNESGNKTWTQKRQARVKEDLKLTPGRHVSLTIPLIELVDKVVKETKVVAFIKGTRTAPQCGFSHKVLTILNESKVEYETINVLDEEFNSNLREVLKEYSQWPTIPQLYVKGEFVGGADIVEEMSTNGELKKLLYA